MASTGAVVSLGAAVLNAGAAVGDRFVSIENLLGSVHGDVLTGDGGANALDGGAGNDTLVGGAGMDVIYGGIGDDYLNGGRLDSLYGGDGVDMLEGEATLLDGGAGDDKISLSVYGAATGGSGADSFRLAFTDSYIPGNRAGFGSIEDAHFRAHVGVISRGHGHDGPLRHNGLTTAR